MAKSAAIISFRALNTHPRVRRQIEFVSPQFEVSTVGDAQFAIPGVPCLDSGPTFRRGLWEKGWRFMQLLLRRYEDFYWRTPHVKAAYQQLRALQPALIIANEYNALPLAIRLKRETGCKIIFDAHEYYPRLFEDTPGWNQTVKPYIHYLCQRYLPETDARTTVSQEIADKYQQRYQCPFALITNAPSYVDLAAQPVHPGKIRMIHHGLCMRNRKLEKMIALLNHLDDRFELSFMLVATVQPDYLRELKQRAGDNPRMHFLDPVPTDDIPRFISQFDIGLFWLEPINFNYRYTLPNKLFEFIQGRLMTVVSNTPAMGRFVRQYQCGLVAPTDDVADLARQMNGLTEMDIFAYKQRAHALAWELSAAGNAQRYQELLMQLGF